MEEEVKPCAKTIAPDLIRGLANKNTRKAGDPMVTQAETLHPQIRPFGHRVTLTDAFPRKDETANVQLDPGITPEEERP